MAVGASSRFTEHETVRGVSLNRCLKVLTGQPDEGGAIATLDMLTVCARIRRPNGTRGQLENGKASC